MKIMKSIEITKEFVSHVVAFSIAESGAMGNADSILFLTDDQEIYEMNYTFEGQVTEVFNVFSVFRQCIKYIQKSEKKLPKGWKYTYMGVGNHLFVLEWLDRLFYKRMGQADASEIYVRWQEVMKQILMEVENKTIFEKKCDVQRTDFEVVPFNAKRKKIRKESWIRESLSVEWENAYARKERIVAIGINPSTAQDGEPDLTMTKLCRFLDMYGFNNVTMLNLYESVSTDQSKKDESTRTDFGSKRELFDNADIILLVWGIGKYKEEKSEAMSVLVEYTDKLYCIKNPKGKFPVHPSRMAYQSVLMPLSTVQDFENCVCHRKADADVKKEESEAVITESDLSVFLNDKFILSLGAGIATVHNFSKLADQGIEGATKVVRSYNCNREVYLSGEMLLNFIGKEYPQYKENACQKIKSKEETYKIVCYDMS